MTSQSSSSGSLLAASRIKTARTYVGIYISLYGTLVLMVRVGIEIPIIMTLTSKCGQGVGALPEITQGGVGGGL